jgi:hypothetical protein
MADPTVTSETLILIDAAGEVTEDRSRAVRGEILQSMSDGTTLSTLFTIEAPR